MLNLTVYAPIGPQYVVSVAATSSTAVAITAYTSDILEVASFLNTGPNGVQVNLFPLGPNGTGVAPPAVLSTPGNPQPPANSGMAFQSFYLTSGMTTPLVMRVPGPFSMTAIGTAAGPASVFVVPLGVPN